MRTAVFFSSVLALSAPALAQNAAKPVAVADVMAGPAAAYQYDADGRRDPFTNLLHSGADSQVITTHGEGLAALMLNEISVRGVMQSRRTLVAMVQGPDKKTYLIHQGDKLADAVVKNVTTDGLVVLQNVSDPLSTQKQREVRKLLRSLEGAK